MRVSGEIANVPRYVYDSYGDIVENPNYDEELRQAKKDRKLRLMNANRAMYAVWAASNGHSPDNAKDNYDRAMRYGGQLRSYNAAAMSWNDLPVFGSGSMFMGQHRNYAEGGYVTGPQQAIVGEGGEPEYILPASKMDEAMRRYGSGMRGSSVIPESANVSVNYNGSTVDMGGSSYINKGDVNGIVSQAVNATLSTLKKSPRARLEAGMR